MVHHGQLYLRDNVPPRSSFFDKGKFGRMFPLLPPFAADTQKLRAQLLEMGKAGGIMDANDPPPPTDPLTPNPDNRDNPTMTASFTFLGQFIDHDVTHDSTSSLERQNDPLPRARRHRLPRRRTAHEGRPELARLAATRNGLWSPAFAPNWSASPSGRPT